MGLEMDLWMKNGRRQNLSQLIFSNYSSYPLKPEKNMTAIRRMTEHRNISKVSREFQYIEEQEEEKKT
jgi:hypothetical protein